MRRPLVNLLLQPAFGEALPQPPGHIGDVDAVGGFVVLEADAFAEALGDLEKERTPRQYLDNVK